MDIWLIATIILLIIVLVQLNGYIVLRNAYKQSEHDLKLCTEIYQDLRDDYLKIKAKGD